MSEATRGLSADELSTPVGTFFARFCWHPPAMDPRFTRARAFFERMAGDRPPLARRVEGIAPGEGPAPGG